MSDIHPPPTMFTEDDIKENPILQYFHFEHLPEELQKVSAPFCGLANLILHTLPRNAERSAAFRKLLEAKDSALRANV